MQKRLSLFLIAVALAIPALAVTDQERATLQRLSTELESLGLIIDQTQRAAIKTDRQQVHYQNLRSDLNRIKQGIKAVVNSPRREPRTLPPIKGEYQ